MTALLTRLGQNENETVYNVGVADVKAGRMTLSGAPILSIGTPVRIVQDRRLWLGEVVECGSDDILVIQLIHSLADVQHLTILADRFLGKQHAPIPTLS